MNSYVAGQRWQLDAQSVDFGGVQAEGEAAVVGEEICFSKEIIAVCLDVPSPP